MVEMIFRVEFGDDEDNQYDSIWIEYDFVQFDSFRSNGLDQSNWG